MEPPPPKWVPPSQRDAKPPVDRGDTRLAGLQPRDQLRVIRSKPVTEPAPGRLPRSPVQRALLGLVLVAVVLGGGYLSLVLLTPSYGTIIGYADRQPPLEVIQPPHDAAPASEVDHIHGVARLYLDYHANLGETYWPEPTTIAERPDCWLVAYTRRVPIYQFLGLRQVIPPTDKYMFLSIAKQDLSLRFGKWCE